MPRAAPRFTAYGDGNPVVIVYSGETYNHTELRAELVSRGHRFTTGSDTEAVLRGYLEWGEAAAERLNGMCACAIWDEHLQQLVMIRDRTGIKPLYHHPTPDGVLFGSEPKAILANPLTARKAGLDGLRELFAFVKTPGHAVREGMREIEPGTVVTVDRSGPHRHVYWSLRTRTAPTPTTATPRSRTSAPSSTTSSAAGSSPTCRAAPCSPAAWTPRR